MQQESSVSRSSQLKWMLADLIFWAVLMHVALWVRHDLALAEMSALRGPALGVLGITMVAMVVLGWLAGLYSPMRRVWPGSHTEILMVVAVQVLSALIGTLAVNLIAQNGMISQSVPLIAGAFVTVVAVAARSVWRWAWSRYGKGGTAERAMIYGSGQRAASFLSTLPGTASNQYRPVAIFADTPDTTGDIVHGMRAQELSEHELRSAIERTDARVMIIITDGVASPEAVAMIKKLCDAANVRVLISSPVAELDEEPKAPASFREISVSDLIGRPPVEIDKDLLSRVLKGRRVLVTGAGGSIGSELCRQIHHFEPAELMMLDRDEGGLHATELSILGTALLDGRNTILADLRDQETVEKIFMERRPEVVLHAAALKHQPLLEQYPAEAMKTNVMGSKHVLDAAAKCGASVIVNVSTDKAANPTSILGESKRAAERLCAEMALEHPGTWVSVRFGNVFGSRGSVVHTFSKQIEDGGPITVTDPDVERFFMTIPEACQLVLVAAAVGKSGETLVLEMGDPVRIADLAEQLIRLHGREGDIEIIYTGLRPGEKLSEELVDDIEDPIVGDRHELITEVQVVPCGLAGEWEAAMHDDDAARHWLRAYGNSINEIAAETAVEQR